MDFLTHTATEIVLIVAGVLATLGAIVYARHSSRPRLAANGLSGARQQSMTTAQGVAMTQTVAGRSDAQPQRRQSIVAAIKNRSPAQPQLRQQVGKPNRP